MARAFDDVVVLDLGQIYNGPYCSMLLAHLGARVLKIEPIGGETTRRRVKHGEAYPFLFLNSDKSGICLNLKDSCGKDLFLRLVEKADVVVENFAVGVMDRLGLGYEALSQVNPRIILASGKGFGSTGPYAGYPAMDLTVQAMTAVMATTGFPESPPVKAGIAVSDFMGGIHLMAGVVSALYQRTRTGRGQYVEVAMQDAVLPSLTSNLSAYFQSGGTVPERTGNRHGGLSLAPYNVYPCQDGWVAIFCVTERHWQALVRVMGRDDLALDPDFKETPDRAARMSEVDGLVSAWTACQTKGAVVATLLEAHVPCAPVVALHELVHDPAVWERGMLAEVDHPVMGKIPSLGNPIRLSDSAPIARRAAPRLGEHTTEVLREYLGLSDDTIAALKAREAIG